MSGKLATVNNTRAGSGPNHVTQSCDLMSNPRRKDFSEHQSLGTHATTSILERHRKRYSIFTSLDILRARHSELLRITKCALPIQLPHIEAVSNLPTATQHGQEASVQVRIPHGNIRRPMEDLMFMQRTQQEGSWPRQADPMLQLLTMHAQG